MNTAMACGYCYGLVLWLRAVGMAQRCGYGYGLNLRVGLGVWVWLRAMVEGYG